MKIKIIRDCLCEHYLHEINNYPREGLIKKEFSKGELFEVKTEFNNFYGSYYRIDCVIDNKPTFADIAKHNAEIYEPSPEDSVKEFLEKEILGKGNLVDLYHVLLAHDERHIDEGLYHFKKRFEKFIEEQNGK